jgi:predicted metal-dependent enzyme (double-stranded beta helix superfamily)
MAGFAVDTLVADCKTALADPDPRGAVRDVLTRLLEQRSAVAAVLGRDEGGIEVLYNDDELTVINFVWAPKMTIYPHEHRMWATIGIYGGAEDNTLWRRGPERIAPAGVKSLEDGDVISLGRDAIHSVHNPRAAYSGAIHVYGGDFVNAPRSQWDPDTLMEQPYDIERIRRLFAEANEAWKAQLGHDLDEQVD